MPNWPDGFAEVGLLKVHYTRTGAGTNKPPILLMHGFTDNGLCWTPVALDLEETYDVIMPDARGHGQTHGSIGSFSIPQLAQDTAGFIQKLGLKKPFLFGHSMGGITAATVSANHPELVRAVVMEDPPFVTETAISPQQKQMMEEIARKDLAFQKMSLEQRIARGKESNPGWSEAEIVPWAESKGEYNPEIMQHRGAFRNYAWQNVISRISVPALLVTGDPARRAIVTPEMAALAARLCPTCQVVQIEGAGHCIHRDRYPQTMQLVTAFLAKN